MYEKPDKPKTQFLDALLEDIPPTAKPTDRVWPSKRQKMLLKNLGYDTDKMTPQEVKNTLQSHLNSFNTKHFH